MYLAGKILKILGYAWDKDIRKLESWKVEREPFSFFWIFIYQPFMLTQHHLDAPGLQLCKGLILVVHGMEKFAVDEVMQT